MGVPITEPVDNTASESQPPKVPKRRSFLLELPFLVAVALVVAVLIKTFLVQAFFIPSLSMVPTLEVGDRVLVNKLAYRLGDVERGDIVVFDSPFSPEHDDESVYEVVTRNVLESLGLQVAATQDFIKRVIAVEGDVIEIRDNHVYVNGDAVAEPYVASGASMPDFGPETIPAGMVFVMGDNRTRSQDSRRFGPIPADEIVGRAFVRVWPVGRFGGL
jgi:signal peptidase I